MFYLRALHGKQSALSAHHKLFYEQLNSSITYSIIELQELKE
jgi:hypothetical protein